MNGQQVHTSCSVYTQVVNGGSNFSDKQVNRKDSINTEVQRKKNNKKIIQIWTHIFVSCELQSDSFVRPQTATDAHKDKTPPSATCRHKIILASRQQWIHPLSPLQKSSCLAKIAEWDTSPWIFLLSCSRAAQYGWCDNNGEAVTELRPLRLNRGVTRLPALFLYLLLPYNSLQTLWLSYFFWKHQISFPECCLTAYPLSCDIWFMHKMTTYFLRPSCCIWMISVFRIRWNGKPNSGHHAPKKAINH